MIFRWQGTVLTSSKHAWQLLTLADSKDLCMAKITDQIETTSKVEILAVGGKTNFTEISTAVFICREGNKFQILSREFLIQILQS